MTKGGPTRRDVLKGVVATSAGLGLLGCGGGDASGVDAEPAAPDAAATPDAAVITPPEATPEVDHFALGISAGDLAADRAVLWTQHEDPTPLEAVVWRMNGDSYVEELGPYPAVPVEGGYVHVALAGLIAGARYRYAFFEIADEGGVPVRTGRSAIGRFRAPIAPGATEIVTFGAVSCVDESQPADVLARAAERDDLDAFLFLGDNAYCEDCTTLADYRGYYTSHYGRPEHVAIRARTGCYMTWDDHEVDNDWNPETIDPDRLGAAFQCFFEHAPIAKVPGADRQIWRSARWGQTVEVFVLDCRSERLPSTIFNGEPQQYISPAQLAWLLDGLSTSPCVFKLIMNSVPITDMPLLWDAYPTDRWEGYANQRTEVLRYIDDQAITGVLWVAGDFHLAFTSRVSPSGPGANQREILVGPGAQSANPLVFTLQPPQFSFATGTNNYTTIKLDPVTRAVSLEYIDGAGAVFHADSFVP